MLQDNEIFEEKAPEVLLDLAKRVETELTKREIDKEQAYQIGIETAQAVAQNWGGCTLYIPLNLQCMLNKRDRQIYAEFNGVNHLQLARKFGVSMQWVYKIVKRITKDEISRRQLDMFMVN